MPDDLVYLYSVGWISVSALFIEAPSFESERTVLSYSGRNDVYGFYEISSSPLKYGLVYKFSAGTTRPTPEIATLASLLADKTFRKPLLGERFSLAVALSYGLLQIHASGWLHRNIRPEIVIFQRTNDGLPIIKEPKLLGFGSTRSDHIGERSLMSEHQYGNIDLSRHPDYQAGAKRFERRFDYFSLGVVLALIGFWESIRRDSQNNWVGGLADSFARRHSERTNDPSLWGEFLRNRVRNYLGSSCGEIYRDAVLRCLGSETDSIDNVRQPPSSANEAEWQQWFLFNVVFELQKCRA